MTVFCIVIHQRQSEVVYTTYSKAGVADRDAYPAPVVNHDSELGRKDQFPTGKYLLSVNKVQSMGKVVDDYTEHKQQRVHEGENLGLNPVPGPCRISNEKGICALEMVVEWGVSIHVVLQYMVAIPLITRETYGV